MNNFYKITITLNLSNNFSYDEVFLLPTSKVSKQSAFDYANEFALAAMKQFKIILSKLSAAETKDHFVKLKIVEKSYKRIPKNFVNHLPN